MTITKTKTHNTFIKLIIATIITIIAWYISSTCIEMISLITHLHILKVAGISNINIASVAFQYYLSEFGFIGILLLAVVTAPLVKLCYFIVGVR